MSKEYTVIVLKMGYCNIYYYDYGKGEEVIDIRCDYCRETPLGRLCNFVSHELRKNDPFFRNETVISVDILKFAKKTEQGNIIVVKKSIWKRYKRVVDRLFRQVKRKIFEELNGDYLRN